MTGLDDPQMQDLIALAASLGRDRLVVQGPGGNISLKQHGVMWVKASGTWMMEAESRPILIPVDFTGGARRSCGWRSRLRNVQLFRSP